MGKHITARETIIFGVRFRKGAKLKQTTLKRVLLHPRQPRPHAADRPPTRLGEPSTAPGRVEGGGQPVLSFEQCFILFCSFPLLFAFGVGGLGFELCVFVAGWRHALRSEWPFIIIIKFIMWHSNGPIPPTVKDRD